MNIWPFSELKTLREALKQSTENFNTMQKVIEGKDCMLRQALEKLGYQTSRNDGLRDALTRKAAEYDALAAQVEAHVDARVNASECHVSVRKDLETALDRIGDTLKNDDGQAFKEAEKFYNRFRSTKNCIKCGSEMIPMHSEDKKMCSNGACGHEIDWKLDEGQNYLYRNNVEPFIEDRSKEVKESLDA